MTVLSFFSLPRGDVAFVPADAVVSSASRTLSVSSFFGEPDWIAGTPVIRAMNMVIISAASLRAVSALALASSANIAACAAAARAFTPSVLATTDAFIATSVATLAAACSAWFVAACSWNFTSNSFCRSAKSFMAVEICPNCF